METALSSKKPGGKAVFNIAGKRYRCFILEKFII